MSGVRDLDLFLVRDSGTSSSAVCHWPYTSYLTVHFLKCVTVCCALHIVSISHSRYSYVPGSVRASSRLKCTYSAQTCENDILIKYYLKHKKTVGSLTTAFLTQVPASERRKDEGLSGRFCHLQEMTGACVKCMLSSSSILPFSTAICITASSSLTVTHLHTQSTVQPYFR